jgi:hypothetical protein
MGYPRKTTTKPKYKILDRPRFELDFFLPPRVKKRTMRKVIIKI